MNVYDTPPGCVRIGRHLWGWCRDCRSYVKLTGLFRGLHICAEPEPAP